MTETKSRHLLSVVVSSLFFFVLLAKATTSKTNFHGLDVHLSASKGWESCSWTQEALEFARTVEPTLFGQWMVDQCEDEGFLHESKEALDERVRGLVRSMAPEYQSLFNFSAVSAPYFCTKAQGWTSFAVDGVELPVHVVGSCPVGGEWKNVGDGWNTWNTLQAFNTERDGVVIIVRPGKKRFFIQELFDFQEIVLFPRGVNDSERWDLNDMVTVYGGLDDECTRLILWEAMTVYKTPILFRPILSVWASIALKGSHWAKEGPVMGGFGVEAQVKKTEYNATDDRSNSNAGDQETEDSMVSVEYEQQVKEFKSLDFGTVLDPDDIENGYLPKNILTYYSFPNVDEDRPFRDIGLKTVQAIVDSSNDKNRHDMLHVFRDIVQNFPSLVHAMDSIVTDSHVMDESRMFHHAYERSMREMTSEGKSDNAIWINSVKIDLGTSNVFDVLEKLLQDEQIVKEMFEQHGIPKDLTRRMQRMDMSDNAAPRFDLRTDHVVYLNNLEKDVQYRRWNSALDGLYRTYPGQMPFMRRNVFNVLIPIDIDDDQDLQLLSWFATIISQNAPIRVGIQFYSSEYHRLCAPKKESVHVDRLIEVDMMGRMSEVDNEDDSALEDGLCDYALERHAGRDLIVKPFLLLNGLCKREAGREFLSSWLNRPIDNVDEKTIEDQLWTILSSSSCNVKRKRVPKYISEDLLSAKKSLGLRDILSDPVLDEFLMGGIDDILTNGLVDLRHHDMASKRLTVNGLVYHRSYVPQQIWGICNYELGNIKEMISREGYGPFERDIEKKIMEGSYKAFHEKFFSLQEARSMGYTPFFSALSREMKLNSIEFPRKGVQKDAMNHIDDIVDSLSSSSNIAQVMLHVVINVGDTGGNGGCKSLQMMLKQIANLGEANLPFRLRVIMVPYCNVGCDFERMNGLVAVSTFEELVEFAGHMSSSSMMQVNDEIDPERMGYLERINEQVISFKDEYENDFRDGFAVQGRFVVGRDQEDELVTTEMIRSLLLNEWNNVLSKLQKQVEPFVVRLPELAPSIPEWSALIISKLSTSFPRNQFPFSWSAFPLLTISSNTERDGNDVPLVDVEAVLDPLSSTAQKFSSIFISLRDQLNASIRILLHPKQDIGAIPLRSYYRHVARRDRGGNVGQAETRPLFSRLPGSLTLTINLDVPNGWLVESTHASDDLDNLRIPTHLNAVANYEIKQNVIGGHCLDVQSPNEMPAGLQLQLFSMQGEPIGDTIVMDNYGYFQLKAPNHRMLKLRLGSGRSSELFEIIGVSSAHGKSFSLNIPRNMRDPQAEGKKEVIIALELIDRNDIYLFVRKRIGHEHEKIIVEMPNNDEVDGGKKSSSTSSFSSFVSGLFGGGKEEHSDEIAMKDENINVFSIVSGHMYERLVKIMMLSVVKRASMPVKFWFLEEYLSPQFKKFLPHMAEKYGFTYQFLSYRWPWWLHRQTEKQRIMWAYKILFLDVLFPIDVSRIIVIDADQVAHVDLKELASIDLKGAPYGYTPFCQSKEDMDGYRFWKTGYWHSHLRGRPYHISALYVVDLDRFRALGAGDILRSTYHSLSKDPGSLSNLDQDLPNYSQFVVPIFSLPQEWLWCETWCSEETKGQAKTIDLCNNPKTKENKLDNARRVIGQEWIDLDVEATACTEEFYRLQKEASERS
eukprot:TRINITY_DN2385_c0_g1_i2.p1 TRINITY_DN2385_c0_g1~~TRINITY_DN2385_c0_g1_i2.p1  ORF type:complete len:1648 (+),score=442.89 TRINITY_DN2385_c0_g1_i2:114-5057(+)